MGSEPSETPEWTEVSWCVPEPWPLSDPQVALAVRCALAQGGRSNVGLSVVFVDDSRLAQMHGEHLGDPSVTDVMSFDLGEDEGVVGELFVSVERALELARRRGVTLERELTLYVVHGALHLAGFDDLEAEERVHMRAAEARVMLELGFDVDGLEHSFGTH